MTAVRRHGVSGFGVVARLFLLLARSQEGYSHLVAIDPGQLAPAVGKPGRRQQQEKLLQVKSLDRAIDSEFSAALGDVLQDAVAAPGAVDTHHMRGNPALEDDAIALAPF